jgi:hexulose-6-phosphate isomerase
VHKSITLRSFPAGLDTFHRIELAAEAGFQGVEVNFESGEEYSLEASDTELSLLRKSVEAAGLRVSATNSREQWKYPITSKEKQTRARGKQVIENLIKAAATLGAGAVLTIPGGVDLGLFAAKPEIVRYDEAYKRSLEALRELAHGVAEPHEVYMAIENVWNKFLLSPLEFATFVDEISSPWAGVYFDVGNVMQTGYPEHWIPILGQRIKRVHVKDFRCSIGNINGFVSLLEGDVNWPVVQAALKGIGYDSWVTAEVLPAYRHYGERLIFETSASMDVILAGLDGTTG